MLPSFMSRPFERRRFPLANDHGTMTVDYSASPTSVTIRGSIQPGTGTTDTINRNGAEVVQTIWAQPDADVQHLDQFYIGGQTYWVNGEPEVWQTGVLDHQVIHLSRWVG